ncbi:hypothetical protein QLX08_002296 [Tetragonisca angustula]|uniref:Uncharacterized protein n=1 Tax=Tetragonisca angustula TaxID=166442 RepID=A0AAW1ADN1_9HYME
MEILYINNSVLSDARVIFNKVYRQKLVLSIVLLTSLAISSLRRCYTSVVGGSGVQRGKSERRANCVSFSFLRVPIRVKIQLRFVRSSTLTSSTGNRRGEVACPRVRANRRIWFSEISPDGMRRDPRRFPRRNNERADLSGFAKNDEQGQNCSTRPRSDHVWRKNRSLE